MAITLYVGDSRSTVDLSSAYRESGYVPKAAPDNEDWITEHGQFQFEGSISAIRGTVQALGKLLVQAREWNEHKLGEPVFVKYKWQSSDDLYRSELYGGVVIPADMATDYWVLNSGTVPFEIEWTRKNYWEDDTLRTLPAHGFNIVAGTPRIYNSYNVKTATNEGIGTAAGGTVYAGTLLHYPVEAYLSPPTIVYTWSSAAQTATVTAGTGATSGGTIAGSGIASGTINYHTGVWGITYSSAPTGTIFANYNYGYGNYIDIAGSAISGDMPAPLLIQFGASGEHVWIGAHHGTAVGWTYSYEAEDVDVSLTAVASATSSGGTHVTDTAGTAYSDYFTVYPMTGIERIRNDSLVPILRLAGTPSTTGGTYSIYNIHFRQMLYAGGGLTDMYSDQRVLPTYTNAGQERHEGIFTLPPFSMYNELVNPAYDPVGGGTGGAYWTMKIKAASGTAESLAVDFIQFFPTAGGYAEIYSVYGLAAGGGGQALDGIGERILSTTGRPGFIHKYDFIRVWPGEPNRIYALWTDDIDFNTTVTDAADVTISYRPRKRSL